MEDKVNMFRPVYRELSQEEKDKLEEIKNKAQELYDLIDSPTRYNALSKTSLEESVMWAVKGITS